MNNNTPSPDVPPVGGLPDNSRATSGPKDTVRLLVAGFIGGLMTPMIQPLQEFLKSHRFPSEFDLGYWLVGTALGCLGAVMVWLLKESDVKKALVLGLSLPAFFTSLGSAVQNSSTAIPAGHALNPTSLSTGIAALFVSTASAQPRPGATAAVPTRTLKVNRATPAFDYKVEVLGDKSALLSSAEVKAVDPSPATIVMPEGATAVRFTAGEASVTKSLEGNPGAIVEATLSGGNFHRTFNVAQVFGKAPDFVPGQISVELAHP